MFDIENVTRYVIGFSKIANENGEYPAEVEYEFSTPVSLFFLQKLFNIDPNEPDEGTRYLISSYKIDAIKAEALQPFIKEKLELDKHYFSLECSDKASYEKWKEREKNGWNVQESDLVRFIAAHPRDWDENSDEPWEMRFELIKPISLEFLRKLFNVKPNDTDFIGFDEIDEEKAKALQPYFKEELDLKRYELFMRAVMKESYVP